MMVASATSSFDGGVAEADTAEAATASDVQRAKLIPHRTAAFRRNAVCLVVDPRIRTPPIGEHVLPDVRTTRLSP
jgi:hypothetical protein